MIQDEDVNVREIVGGSLVVAFQYIAGREMVWQDLDNLTKDSNINVRG